ncbi:MAG: hypothetical protein IBX64_10265 [Actinobacteria bacterium]|nr:hypothetical protein [Actinomycetota bacterium]
MSYSLISKWKLERKDLMIAYLEVLYNNENILLRFKMYEGYGKIAPLFSEIIAEGQQQGLFNVDDADETSEIFISMLQGFGERLASQVLLLGEKPETAEAVLRKCLAFEKALERLLGLKGGTLKIYDPERLKQFFDYFIEKSNEKDGGTRMSSEKSALSVRQNSGGGAK